MRAVARRAVTGDAPSGLLDDLAAHFELIQQAGLDGTAILGSDPQSLDTSIVEQLSRKLIRVKTIEYWPRLFLERISPTHSRVVLDLFLERIRHVAGDRTYHAIPFTAHDFGDLGDRLAQSPTFVDELTRILSQYETMSHAEQERVDILFGHLGRSSTDFAKQPADRRSSRITRPGASSRSSQLGTLAAT